MHTVFATKPAPFFTATIRNGARRATSWSVVVAPAPGHAGPVQITGRFATARAAEAAARAVFSA